MLGAERCPGAGFLQQPQDVNLVSTLSLGFLKLLSFRSWEYWNANNIWGDGNTAKVPDPALLQVALSSLSGFPCLHLCRAPRTQHQTCSRALSLRAASPAQANLACPQGPAPALSPRHLPLVTCKITGVMLEGASGEELCSGWHSLDQPPPGTASWTTGPVDRTYSQGEPGLAVPQVSWDPSLQETAKNLLLPLGSLDSILPFYLAKGLEYRVHQVLPVPIAHP